MFLHTFSCDNVIIAPAAINGPLDKLKTYRLVVIVVVVAVVLCFYCCFCCCCGYQLLFFSGTIFNPFQKTLSSYNLPRNPFWRLFLRHVFATRLSRPPPHYEKVFY